MIEDARKKDRSTGGTAITRKVVVSVEEAKCWVWRMIEKESVRCQTRFSSDQQEGDNRWQHILRPETPEAIRYIT
jgi:hypothetical protein